MATSFAAASASKLSKAHELLLCSHLDQRQIGELGHYLTDTASRKIKKVNRLLHMDAAGIAPLEEISRYYR